MIDRASKWLYLLMLDAEEGARSRFQKEDGQAFVEYAMVLLLVTVALAAGAFIDPFRNALVGAFQAIADKISNPG
jgi:Flp pilus assembly pilin Flp